jgi:hypothetical protein
VTLGRVGTGRARPGRGRAGLRRPLPHAALPATGLDVTKVLEYVGLIVAPTTLVTALVYWLGFELVDARSAYFGLGTGTLGYSPTDYLLRGAEAGIVPLFVLFTAVLVAAGLHATVTAVATLAGRAPWVRRAAWGTLAAGTAVFVTGLVGLFTPLLPPLDWYLLRPVLLAAGPLVAIQAARLLRAGTDVRASRTAAVAVAGLLALSAFWAMSIYADALGRGRAIDLGADVTSEGDIRAPACDDATGGAQVAVLGRDLGRQGDLASGDVLGDAPQRVQVVLGEEQGVGLEGGEPEQVTGGVANLAAIGEPARRIGAVPVGVRVGDRSPVQGEAFVQDDRAGEAV